MSAETIAMFAAEIVVVGTAIAIYLGGSFVPRPRLWRWLAVVGLVAAAVILTEAPAGRVADAPLEVDGLSNYLRWIALASGLLLVTLGTGPIAGQTTAEYLGSLLLATAGAMLVASTRDLVLLFVTLEMVSIPTYILLYLGRGDSASQEAAAKYFYLSVFASALLLYGFNFLYAAAGSMDLCEIHARLGALHFADGAFGAFGKIALALILAGLGFRLAAAPFHFYAADVYQGTTHQNAALLSILPKIVALAALVRVVAVAMGGLETYAWPAVLAISLVTMTWGNVVALWQDHVRRLLAYSSIAHAGYLLIGLAAFLGAERGSQAAWDGLGAMLFYLLTYGVATIGVFAALAVFGTPNRQLDEVEQLAGLAWTPGAVRRAMAWLLAVFLLSLTGIPPLAGFWGKLAIFASALDVAPVEARPWFIALAVAGVVNSAIGAAYYLRVVGVMFFRPPSAPPAVGDRIAGPVAAAWACALVTVVLVGLNPGPWLGWANRSSSAAAAARQQHEQTGPQANLVRPWPGQYLGAFRPSATPAH
jgi:NADH-quinone oxidoreductase subunit N